MKASEELMVLLELNGFDITKYKLKKQLEYEKTGNLELYKFKKFSDLLVCHYSYEEDKDYFHRNPLSYRDDWGDEVKSLDQFYINHPDIEQQMTLKEFLTENEFNEINREAILYDIMDTWVEEYREASITEMENLREMIRLLPKKSKKYRKPSKSTFVIAILLALIPIFLFTTPQFLKPPIFGFISDLVDAYVELLYDVEWYSLFGQIVIFLFVFYAVTNNFLSRYIRDVRNEKNKRSDKTFDKWDKDMKNARLKQSGILEDYVDLLIKKPKKSHLDIKSLTGPRKLLDKFKNYVRMIEGRYDWMTRNYKKYFRYIRILYLFSFISFIAFFGVGFALSRGWI